MKVVLLSIKTKYVDLIRNGSKRFEYRKSIFKSKSKIILVYSSGVEKKLSGVIIHGKVRRGDPKVIWDETKESAGITEDEFFSYFHNRTVAYAIEIERYIEFSLPIDITSREIRPPQSFSYVDLSQNNRLTVESGIMQLMGISQKMLSCT